MTPIEKTSLVKHLARELTFDLVGITRLVPSRQAKHYRQWLAKGHAGEMVYLQRNRKFRENPALLLDGAVSAICVALNYRRADTPKSGTDYTGRVAQYVRGADYHRVIRGMLSELLARLQRDVAEKFDYRIFVDTGPILERDLAHTAGLGWIGKNTMLINHRLGSFFFLAEVLTTLELQPDKPVEDRCGSCTRCIDACPTRALLEPRRMDAARCISYLTIEQRGDVPVELRESVGDWVYGCDVCQQVCPYNRRAPLATHPEIAAELLPGKLPLEPLLTLSSGDYRRLVKGTAATRVSRKMWQRNALLALANTASAKRQYEPEME